MTSIGVGAFDGHNRLTSVTIPDSVTNIGVGAFGGCYKLMNMTIGSGVTSIGRFAFSECESLTSVTFQGKTMEQVQTIEDGEGNKWYPWGIEDTSIITVA